MRLIYEDTQTDNLWDDEHTIYQPNPDEWSDDFMIRKNT
jgi:hypothetical protein